LDLIDRNLDQEEDDEVVRRIERLLQKHLPTRERIDDVFGGIEKIHDFVLDTLDRLELIDDKYLELIANLDRRLVEMRQQLHADDSQMLDSLDLARDHVRLPVLIPKPPKQKPVPKVTPPVVKPEIKPEVNPNVNINPFFFTPVVAPIVAPNIDITNRGGPQPDRSKGSQSFTTIDEFPIGISVDRMRHPLAGHRFEMETSRQFRVEKPVAVARPWSMPHHPLLGYSFKLEPPLSPIPESSDKADDEENVIVIAAPILSSHALEQLSSHTPVLKSMTPADFIQYQKTVYVRPDPIPFLFRPSVSWEIRPHHVDHLLYQELLLEYDYRHLLRPMSTGHFIPFAPGKYVNVSDITTESLHSALKIIQKHYENRVDMLPFMDAMDPVWRSSLTKLGLDYAIPYSSLRNLRVTKRFA